MILILRLEVDIVSGHGQLRKRYLDASVGVEDAEHSHWTLILGAKVRSKLLNDSLLHEGVVTIRKSFLFQCTQHLQLHKPIAQYVDAVFLTHLPCVAHVFIQSIPLQSEIFKDCLEWLFMSPIFPFLRYCLSFLYSSALKMTFCTCILLNKSQPSTA